MKIIERSVRMDEMGRSCRSQSTDTEVELTEGMNLDKACAVRSRVPRLAVLPLAKPVDHQGYLSPYLCLDASNPTSRTWEARRA